MTATPNSLLSSIYREPSEILQRLFLPPKDPSLTVSQDYQWLLFATEPPYWTIDSVATTYEEKLGGIRFDPSLWGPSHLDWASDLVAQHLGTGRTIRIPQPDPSVARGIRFIRFNPNPIAVGCIQQFVFTSLSCTATTSSISSTGYRMGGNNNNKADSTLLPYICNLTKDENGDYQWTTVPLSGLHPQQHQYQYRLNFCNGCAYQFTNDGLTLLVKAIPTTTTTTTNHSSTPPPPKKLLVPVGPSIQSVSKDARKAPGRTYQDLLKNRHDEEKFRYYMTVELVAVDLSDGGGNRRRHHRRDNDNKNVNVDHSTTIRDDNTNTSTTNTNPFVYDRVTIVPQSVGGKLISKFTSSPSGRFLLVEIVTTFSYSVPLNRFGKDIQIWDLQHEPKPPQQPPSTDDGANANSPTTITNNNNNNISMMNLLVASIPVDDEIPISYDACTRHPRSYTFHPCHPHTLLYVQAVDGGDPNNPPSLINNGSSDNSNNYDEGGGGERDVLYSQGIVVAKSSTCETATTPDHRTTTTTTSTANRSDSNSSTILLADPQRIVGLEWRFADVDFTESGEIGLVREYRWKDRTERLWRLQKKKDDTDKDYSIDPATRTTTFTTTSTIKHMVWERNWQDRYGNPGTPIMRRSTGGQNNGQSYLIEPQKGCIYLSGAGASPLGDRPFLDVRCLSTGDTQRIWRCKAPKDGDLVDESATGREVGGRIPSIEEREDVYESMVLLLDDNDTMLLSRESKTTPRNYYLTKLSDLSKEITVTTFPHPQPDLLGVKKELVRYNRKDGVKLAANLYLPKDYDDDDGSSSTCRRRPTLFWAYPREFKEASTAGQVKASQHKFVSASWASPIHWAAKGWVVMDDFTLPVIGEGDTHPNDTFIQQIVDGATAAVDYAVTERGVTDPKKCAVGGHSYGAFMTAHLLSHTSLFAAGIGRSGAYNRTLTPMSFQSEDRSLWDAPETYIAMTPLMHVKKFSEQERVGKLLLIHGEEDENSGTHPLQSERYFAALKAFGIESRLCLLPHERHSYRAKESILHMAWEQEEWLKNLEE